MAVVYRCVGILTVDVVFFRSPGAVLCEPLQRTHLQRPLLKMSPIAGDETSRVRNPENGRRRDFGRRRRHRQSGFQHTDGPQPSSPELFNKDHSFIDMKCFSWAYNIISLSYLSEILSLPAQGKLEKVLKFL